MNNTMVTNVNFPQNSIVTLQDFDYYDSYRSVFNDVHNQCTTTYIGKAFFGTSPKWVDYLFTLRNKLVAFLGLKTSGKLKNREELLRKFDCNPGQKFGFFKVYQKTQNEIVLGEDDKHLNFVVSILQQKVEQHKNHLIISTVVKFNNRFGKLYFFIIKPFHKRIVRSMLARMTKDLNSRFDT